MYWKAMWVLFVVMPLHPAARGPTRGKSYRQKIAVGGKRGGDLEEGRKSRLKGKGLKPFETSRSGESPGESRPGLDRPPVKWEKPGKKREEGG